MSLSRKIILILLVSILLLALIALNTFIYTNRIEQTSLIIHKSSHLQIFAYKTLQYIEEENISEVSVETFSRLINELKSDLSGIGMGTSDINQIGEQLYIFLEAKERLKVAESELSIARANALKLLEYFETESDKQIKMRPVLNYVLSGNSRHYTSAKERMEYLMTELESRDAIVKLAELNHSLDSIYVFSLRITDNKEYLKATMQNVGIQIEKIHTDIENNQLRKSFIVKIYSMAIVSIGILFGIVIIILIRRYLTGFFTDHKQAIECIKNDDCRFVATFKSGDELGDLMKVLESLSASIANRTEELKSRIEERENLVKELYHRTKNNMQIIISLLRIKTMFDSNKQLTEFVDDISAKIQSMALVHRMLYKGSNLSSINLNDYIEEMSQTITRDFGVDEKPIKVFTNLKCVSVSFDTAVPIGLVLSELMINTFKHAFPAQFVPSGDIRRISIKLEEVNDSLILEYSDNGIGIPPNVDLKNINSTGIRIIFSIIESQLFGKISYASGNGLKFFITLRNQISVNRPQDSSLL